MDDKKIQLYTLSTCSHCKSTKRFLDQCTVQYDVTDVDLLDGQEREAILEDLKAINPHCTFPTIVIGKRVIVGFREKEIREALEAL